MAFPGTTQHDVKNEMLFVCNERLVTLRNNEIYILDANAACLNMHAAWYIAQCLPPTRMILVCIEIAGF